MIDKDGDARLADFGFLTIVSDSTRLATTTTSEGVGTLRWMSPELLDPEQFGSKNGRPTKESDCYALGMVILEILTGRVPFPRCSNPVVFGKIIKGKHPGRPKGPEAVWFTDALWGMLKQCWLDKPKLRPTVEGVLECLERSLETWKPLSPSEDGDPQVDSDDSSVSTIRHHACMFSTLYVLTHLCNAHVAGEVVPRDDDEPPGLSQCHSPDVDAGECSSPQLPPEIQQQPNEPQVSTTSYWFLSS